MSVKKINTTFCEIVVGYEITHYQPRALSRFTSDHDHPCYSSQGSDEEIEFDVYAIIGKEKNEIPDGELKQHICDQIRDVVIGEAREQYADLVDAIITEWKEDHGTNQMRQR